MRLNNLGEFGLIEKIKKWLRPLSAPGLVCGIGDDTAVLKYSRDQHLLLSSDALVQGVHFDLKRFSPALLGAKALAVNLSDIAAMAGTPRWALVSLALPGNLSVDWVKDFYLGMKRLAAQYQVQIVGGNTALSPCGVMITITILGECPRQRLVLRSGARVGDLIAVTGRFGLSALKNYAVAPPVRLKEGQLLGQHKIASALIDSSDGLVASVEQLCSSSGTGAVLDLSCIPRARGATLRQALYGGEDYELVFTFPPSKVALLERLEAVTIVGRVVEKKKGLRLLTRQRKIQRPQKGYDHFKND